MVVFVILVASLCGLAYAATEASKAFNEKHHPGQESVTGGSGSGAGQSVENLLNLHSEETVARKNKDLRDRTEKLMARHCGNIETTLGRWASTVRKEVPKDDYAIASHVLHGQIKAAAIQGKVFHFLVKMKDLPDRLKTSRASCLCFSRMPARRVHLSPRTRATVGCPPFGFSLA